MKAQKRKRVKFVLKTALCDLLGIEYPIIQGGMAWLGTAELVSAVSNAGGLGIIGAGNARPDWVRQQIHLTRQLTDKPFGVNILLLSPYTEKVVETVLAERVAVVATGAGNPETYIPQFKQAGIKVIPVVASVASAKRMEQAGVDAIVAEGMESGGEVGETTTMALVPQVIDSVRIPVVAAGGIGDGRGLAAALALGAQGVQIGTRFICSDECVAHPGFKDKILKSGDRSTIVTGQSIGAPVRRLQNALTRQFVELEKGGATREEINLLGRGTTYLGLIEGNVEEGSLPAGQIAGLIKEIKPVRIIIEEMVAQAVSIIKNLEERITYG